MLYFVFDTGTHEPVLGETINVVGAEGETAEVWSYRLVSGSWGAGTAFGEIYIINCSQAFIDNHQVGDFVEDADNNTIARIAQVLTDNCEACYIEQVTGIDVGQECMRVFNTDDIDAEIFLDGSNWP